MCNVRVGWVYIKCFSFQELGNEGGIKFLGKHWWIQKMLTDIISALTPTDRYGYD